MNTLDNMLAEIVADPTEETRWLVLADWLEEHDDVRNRTPTFASEGAPNANNASVRCLSKSV